MSTWNRRVSATANGSNLQVDETTPNPNPPGKNDSADYITVSGSDRPATINYIADGVSLSGIRMKDSQPVPRGLDVSVDGNGARMVLTDEGVAGTDYSYFVVGSYDSNPVETEDPQIHNIA